MAVLKAGLVLCLFAMSSAFRLPEFNMPSFSMPSFSWNIGPTYGQCPENIRVKQSFNPTKFQGVWYGLQRFANPYQVGVKCSSTNITESDSVVSIVNAGKYIWLGSETRTEGTLSFDTANSAKMTYTTNPLSMAVSLPYWVLQTDYDTFALVYSCSNLQWGINMKNEYAWILTRERGVLSTERKQALRSFLTENGVTRAFNDVDQTDC